jgi:hypothetical protein
MNKRDCNDDDVVAIALQSAMENMQRLAVAS